MRTRRRDAATTRQRRSAAGEPIGEVAFHKYPTSRWRRYDQMDRFPTGIIPFGDAVVSFNPTYGQGMTMTSIQAGNLRAVLESGDPDIAGRLSRATKKTTWPVWTMNAIGDLALHKATGRAPWWYGPVGDLFDQFLGAAETEADLAEWFLRRFSLLDSLYMVPVADAGRAHQSGTIWRLVDGPAARRPQPSTACDPDPAQVDDPGGRDGGTYGRLGGVDGRQPRRQVGLGASAIFAATRSLLGAEVLGPEVDHPVDVLGLLQRRRMASSSAPCGALADQQALHLDHQDHRDDAEQHTDGRACRCRPRPGYR